MVASLSCCISQNLHFEGLLIRGIVTAVPFSLHITNKNINKI